MKKSLKDDGCVHHDGAGFDGGVGAADNVTCGSVCSSNDCLGAECCQMRLLKLLLPKQISSCNDCCITLAKTMYS